MGANEGKQAFVGPALRRRRQLPVTGANDPQVDRADAASALDPRFGAALKRPFTDDSP
jgi:hypothetical protein